MSDRVLLLPGADTPSAAWSPVLVDGLRAAGYGVLRHDHRPDPTTLHDLVVDVAASLDEVGASAVHVIGSSMGAMVAQLLAIDHPEAVRTLTLLIATATPGDPPPTDAYLAAAADLAFSDHADDPAAWARLLAGTRYPITTSLAPFGLPTTHAGAVDATPAWVDRLGAVSHPTLIVNGTADPLFTLPHGERLAEALPNAQLLLVDGLGHELPDELFADVLPDMLSHLRLSPA